MEREGCVLLGDYGKVCEASTPMCIISDLNESPVSAMLGTYTLCWRDSEQVHPPLFSNLLSALKLNCIDVIRGFLCFCFLLGLVNREPPIRVCGRAENANHKQCWKAGANWPQMPWTHSYKVTLLHSTVHECTKRVL